jgi:hypothetical protein
MQDLSCAALACKWIMIITNIEHSHQDAVSNRMPNGLSRFTDALAV